MICDYFFEAKKVGNTAYFIQKFSKYYIMYFLYYAKCSIFKYNGISRVEPLVASDLSCQIKKVCSYLAEEIY